MVERPDGRLKRILTVAGMKEAEAIAKRDLSPADAQSAA